MQEQVENNPTIKDKKVRVKKQEVVEEASTRPKETEPEAQVEEPKEVVKILEVEQKPELIPIQPEVVEDVVKKPRKPKALPLTKEILDLQDRMISEEVLNVVKGSFRGQARMIVNEDAVDVMKQVLAPFEYISPRKRRAVISSVVRSWLAEIAKDNHEDIIQRMATSMENKIMKMCPKFEKVETVPSTSKDAEESE